MSAIGKETGSNTPAAISHYLPGAGSIWVKNGTLSQKWLTDPNFVAIVPTGRRLLFFYRDTDRRNEIPFIGSICQVSSGNTLTYETLVKAPISCDIGDFSFTKLVQVKYSKLGIYAIFMTPTRSFRKSAICFYTYEWLERKITTSAYLDENLNKITWPPSSAKNKSIPHPTLCSNDVDQETRQFQQRFLRKYPQLETRISLNAIVYSESSKYGSHTAFDTDGDDVIFIGTDQGFLLTVVKYMNEEYKLFEAQNIFNTVQNCGNFTDSSVMRDVKLIQQSSEEVPMLYMAFDKCIVSIPATSCNKPAVCSEETCSK